MPNCSEAASGGYSNPQYPTDTSRLYSTTPLSTCSSADCSLLPPSASSADHPKTIPSNSSTLASSHSGIPWCPILSLRSSLPLSTSSNCLSTSWINPSPRACFASTAHAATSVLPSRPCIVSRTVCQRCESIEDWPLANIFFAPAAYSNPRVLGASFH